MACPAPGCIKPPISAFAKCLVQPFLGGNDNPSVMSDVVGEKNRFIVAFCGSGTGHLTQALKVVEILQGRGMVLAGVVTDSDAPQKMLDETIMPLGVELLVIPAIELVDTERGFLPLIAPHQFVGSLMKATGHLVKEAESIVAFFKRTKAGQIFNMYHVTLARFFQLNPLPPSITITHMAAQFGLCELTYEQTQTFMEVGGKAVMDIMASIFESSGQTVPIGPRSKAGTLPPIIHIPAPLETGTKPLILCYFLVQTNAKMLDEILLKNPMPGIEVHCFTSKPLETTRSQLQSHQKQRKLFTELFAKCTGVIVSAGNETIWEAVCRGVPVLAIPTEGHGEQLLNAAVHASNFPSLVRTRPKLRFNDLSWLVNVDKFSTEARNESADLRSKVTTLLEQGSPLLGGPPAKGADPLV